MTVENLSDTVIPKSDQINADDLIGGAMTIHVTAVTRGDGEQPISIHYEGDNKRPYKPCKSMRRVLIHAWGDDGRQWAGKSMTLYCDPEVKFGGVKVGGIRISHLSDIERGMDIALTSTRGKRTPYRIEVLKPPAVVMYPPEKFDAELPKMLAALESGKSSLEKIIAFCEKTGKLTDDQKAQLTLKETY
jgi:hypothetical protein